MTESSEEIKQLINTEYDTKERKEFEEGIKKGQAAAASYKWFALGLSKEADRINNTDIGKLMQQDMMLCRLVYFIRFKKKYDGINAGTIDSIILIMEKTHTKELRDLGKKGLEKYIELLEKHLKLAKSVYTVAIDLGDFEPIKGR